MALDLLSEDWATWPPPPPPPPLAAAAVTSSPRISFSCDVEGGAGEDQHRHCCKDVNSLVDVDSPTSSEFDFCVDRGRPEQDHSAADELFADGFLLPLFFIQRAGSQPKIPVANPAGAASTTTANGGGEDNKPVKNGTKTAGKLKAFIQLKMKHKDAATVPAAGNASAAADNPARPIKPSSSFWRFGRSSSLNCGGGNGDVSPAGRKSSRLLCSFPPLSRSKSTGANPSPPATKYRQQHLQNTNGTFSTALMASAVAAAAGGGGGGKLSRTGSADGGPAARSPYYYGQQSGGAGVRISPVLNVPPPYLPRGGSSGVFSLAHLLCIGKAKGRKKTQLHFRS